MSLVHAAATIINAELLATLTTMSDSSDDELPVGSRGAQFFSDNLAAGVSEQWDRLTHGEFGRYTSGRSVDTKDPQPSHRLATATPDAGRLAAAAADRSLDGARALMGEDWTNRLAALLPRGWVMGPCAGGRDGPVVGAAAALEPFEPPCFDRLEATWIHQIDFSRNHEDGALVDVRLVAVNEDDGVVDCTHGSEQDLQWNATPPSSCITEIVLRAFGDRILSWRVYYDDGGSIPYNRVSGDHTYTDDPNYSFALPRLTAPPGLAIRSFYGLIKRQKFLGNSFECFIAGLGVIYGPRKAAAWSPHTTYRFADASVARARAVQELATRPGRAARVLTRNMRPNHRECPANPLRRLPEAVLAMVLAFAVPLFE